MLSAAPNHPEIRREFDRVPSEIDSLFRAFLNPSTAASPRLCEAMRYATIGGGKRLRPLLVLGSAQLFGVPREQALLAGVAVECVHVNSLIHDDLPCMDDDDLRRGKPSAHRAYGEASAILAGTALFALGFEILASRSTHPDPEIRCRLVRTLAEAAGPAGMAGGQMIELESVEGAPTLAQTEHLQRLKTGALIGWSVQAGAIMGRADASECEALREFGRRLGLAFQIADDLLDVEGDEAIVGKRVAKDSEAGKKTLISLLGKEAARRRADGLVREAQAHLDPFGPEAHLLRYLAEFSVSRDR